MTAYSICLAMLVVFSATLAMAARSDANDSSELPPPTSVPTSSGTKIVLPESFSIFQTVNPFSPKTRTTTSPAGGPEAVTVLSGTAESDAGWTAFLQDAGTKTVAILSVGDPVARGRLTRIDLDSIEYDVSGTKTRVEVGQNLNGQVIPPAPAASQPAGQPDQAEQPPSGHHANGPHGGKHPPPEIQPSEQGE